MGMSIPRRAGGMPVEQAPGTCHWHVCQWVPVEWARRVGAAKDY
jgi:hypothetical protein